MKSKSRSSFLVFSLILTWAIMVIVISGQPAVFKAQAEESTTTEVPDVTEMSQADAQSELMEAGLVLGMLTQASSETVPAGNVMNQSPAAETSVAPGTAINLVISAGPAISVPNVVGMSQADAQTAITGAGLTVGMVQMTISKTVSTGRVITQNPGAKTAVAKGSTVNLIVSSGLP